MKKTTKPVVKSKSWSEVLGHNPIRVNLEILQLDILLEAIKIAYSKMSDSPYYVIENNLMSIQRKLEKTRKTIVERKK